MASNAAENDDGAGEAESLEKAKFQIFRYEDAKGLEAHPGALDVEPLPENLVPLQMKAIEAGLRDGQQIKYLVKMPGYSITHVWFKHDFPLPLHSHNSDCMYYIVAGTIRLGTETLGPRDSFFVPCDVPYTYRPGPEGVELLEFRHETSANLRHFSKAEKWWEKAVETCVENRESWIEAKMPPLNC
jgi:mannose-6-phosphate isomerase-like protein (cupin superfamily)